jgi:hypothetical protein
MFCARNRATRRRETAVPHSRVILIDCEKNRIENLRSILDVAVTGIAESSFQKMLILWWIKACEAMTQGISTLPRKWRNADSTHPAIHCALSHSFSSIPATSSQVAKKSFGNDNDSASRRICRGDCNSLFRFSAFIDQSTTPQNIMFDKAHRIWRNVINRQRATVLRQASSANGVENGRSQSTGKTGGLCIAGLFRAYRCWNVCFHVCLVDAR